MLTLLKSWTGEVDIDDKHYINIEQATSDFKSVSDYIHIKLHALTKKRSEMQAEALESNKQEYRITVKRYMTEKASPGFDFMSRWNNNVPMPLRSMVGIKTNETRGMVYMQLHGDIYAEKICTCMKCGRQLRNPVSQFFGIGPECGNHGYVNPFNSEEELKSAVAEYRRKLQKITWEGWIIKSAIIEEEEL